MHRHYSYFTHLSHHSYTHHSIFHASVPPSRGQYTEQILHSIKVVSNDTFCSEKTAVSYKKGKGHPMILSPFAVLSCQPHYSWPVIAYGSTLSTVNCHQAASFIPLENHQEVMLNLL